MMMIMMMIIIIIIIIIISTQHTSIKFGTGTWATISEVLTEIIFRFCVDPL